MKEEECEFDKHGDCHALGCYSSQPCNARDEKGNPIYIADFRNCTVCKGVTDG